MDGRTNAIASTATVTTLSFFPQRGRGGAPTNQAKFTVTAGKKIRYITGQIYTGEMVCVDCEQRTFSVSWFYQNQFSTFRSDSAIVSITDTEVILGAYRTPHGYTRTPTDSIIMDCIYEE